MSLRCVSWRQQKHLHSKLKDQLKQLLDFLPLAFALPTRAYFVTTLAKKKDL
jgi:hypothetical protein